MAEMRQTRQYIQLSEAAIRAMLSAINSFNSVYGDYKTETTFLLLSNAWELLAKAVLLKQKKNIYEDEKKTKSITCEAALNKLLHLGELEQEQVELLQQIVSIRNRCAHDVLPTIPEEIQHHLLFFGCKFFKTLAEKHFSKKYSKTLSKNFLTLSFDYMTTYADKVQKLVSVLRKGNKGQKELIWLLERGVRYTDNNKYISQSEFEKLYKGKKKITPYLKLGDYIEKAEMVRIVPVQAPKNYSADITLRKGSKKQEGGLPVVLKKSDINIDYPFLTKDIAEKLGKTQNYIARLIANLSLKGNSEYHQSIRISQKGEVQRYSNKTLEYLKDHLTRNPDYNPYTR